MRFVLWGAILSSALMGSALAATTARAAGLDGLHTKVQIGNRLCMAGHMHHGSGHAWGAREQALAAAAKAWGSFTALEYGREWAEFRNASNPDVSCWSSPGLGQSGLHWACSVSASPCQVTHPGPVVVPGHRRPHHVIRSVRLVPTQQIRLDR